MSVCRAYGVSEIAFRGTGRLPGIGDGLEKCKKHQGPIHSSRAQRAVERLDSSPYFTDGKYDSTIDASLNHDTSVPSSQPFSRREKGFEPLVCCSQCRRIEL